MNKATPQYSASGAVKIKGSVMAFALAGTFLLSGCRGCKEVKKTDDTVATGNCKVENKSPRTLVGLMKQREFGFNTVSLKMDCEAEIDSSKQSFDMTVRIRKDSVIWINITDPVLGIAVARTIITTDSVKFVQFLPKCKSFKGDFAYISKMLNAELDFESIQSLFIGNSAVFYEEDEKLKSLITEQCQYQLSTIRRRRLRRAEEGQGRPLSEPYQTITLDTASYKILGILFKDPSANRSFGASYYDFTDVGEPKQVFPQQADFVVTAEKSAKVHIRYKKVTLNKNYEYPFSIPDDCEPIQIKEPR